MIHANPQPGSKSSAKETHADKPFVVEYYYKAKWGHAEEFIRLFRKNHYPVLKKQVDSGRMLRVYRRQAALSCHRGWTMGLPGDHRLQERRGGVCSAQRGRRDQEKELYVTNT